MQEQYPRSPTIEPIHPPAGEIVPTVSKTRLWAPGASDAPSSQPSIRRVCLCTGLSSSSGTTCHSSVAEARANMVPTVFLPYPHHGDDHQRHNAQPMVDLGGASIVVDEIDAERTAIQLGDTLRTLLTSEKLLDTMRDALGRTPLQDAADLIAERILAHGDWKRPALT